MRFTDPARPTRRRLLACVAVGAATLRPGRSPALSMREMTVPEAAAYANRCGGDSTHNADLNVAIARLREAGVTFDEPALRASLTCPLCGCRITAVAPRPAG